jgi:hypothetical protein
LRHFDDIIYKYYPKGISYFSGEYEETKEYHLFSEKIKEESYAWEKFIDSCIEEFGLESVEDRSNNEPGNILILSQKLEKKNFIFVLYISKLVEKYCYHVKYIADVSTHIFPDFNVVSKIDWNQSPNYANNTVSKVLALMKVFYPTYTTFDGNLDDIVPNVSTQVHDIGESKLLNVLFSNYLF